MSENQVKLSYKIFLESEDVSQSRILSSTSYVRNLLKNCTNHYFQNAEIDDESDLDDFVLRLYLESDVEEEVCSAPDSAAGFVADMAELLDAIAQAQSYMDMEGSFSISYQGETESYSFTSESGQDFCDFAEAAEDASL